MSKPLLFSFFAVLIQFVFTPIFAQKNLDEVKLEKINKYLHRGKTTHFLDAKKPFKLRNSLQKSNAEILGSRLIAFAIEGNEYDIFPNDSVRFFYNGAEEYLDLEKELLDMVIDFEYPVNEPYKEIMDDEIYIKLDSAIYFNIDSNNDSYYVSKKSLSEFDANGNLTSIINLIYEDNWENDERELFTYNDQNLLTSHTIQEWDGLDWVNDFKKSITYDANNNITELIYYDWDDFSDNWIPDYRKVGTYENGEITEITTYFWDESWQNEEKYLMVYSNGNLIEFSEEEWENSSWQPVLKIENSFNTNNQFISEKFLFWFNGSYMDEYRTVFEYDEMGVKTNKITQYYTGLSWTNIDREIYNYSSVGYLTQITMSDWEDDDFEDTERFTFTNNTYGQHLRMDSEVWMGSEWISMPMFYQTPKFYYEEFDENGAVSGLTEKSEENKIEIYPNPASDFINVKCKDQNIEHIKIVDINGKLVFETISSFHANEVQIPVSQLQSGVYILHVTSRNQIVASTFVVNP